jgi:hypothetical protein
MTAVILSFPANAVRRRVLRPLLFDVSGPPASNRTPAQPGLRFETGQRVTEDDSARTGTVLAEVSPDIFRVKFDGDSIAIVAGRRLSPLFPETA